MPVRVWLCLAAVVLLAVLATTTLRGQRGGVFRESRDHPAIRYSDGPRSDAVTALDRAVQAGEVALVFEPTTGYLHSVLEALDVPVESQLTVFSETSFQAHRINPENPRAIYFNDTVAVGWVRGGDVLEVASLDPTQGVLFFSIDQKPTDRPQIRRNDRCLACHLAWDTLGVPGLLTFSTLPMPDDPNAYAVGWVTDHRSPLEERWGSWYVTGAPPSMRHLGNTTEPIEYVPGASTDPTPALDTLEGLFDLTGYPTPYSDLVALLVLEHRTHMTNLLVRMGWEARVADYEAARAGQPPADQAAAIRDTAVELVDYLLFVDEAPLPARHPQHLGIRGTILGPRPVRQPGPIAAPTRPRRPAVALPVQLPHHTPMRSTPCLSGRRMRCIDACGRCSPGRPPTIATRASHWTTGAPWWRSCATRSRIFRPISRVGYDDATWRGRLQALGFGR